MFEWRNASRRREGISYLRLYPSAADRVPARLSNRMKAPGDLFLERAIAAQHFAILSQLQSCKRKLNFEILCDALLWSSWIGCCMKSARFPTFGSLARRRPFNSASLTTTIFPNSQQLYCFLMSNHQKNFKFELWFITLELLTFIFHDFSIVFSSSHIYQCVYHELSCPEESSSTLA